MRRAAWVVVCAGGVGCLFPDVEPLTSDASITDSALDVPDVPDVPDASAPCGDPTVVIGSSVADSGTDNTPAPYLDSFPATTTNAATVACGWLYLVTTPTAPVHLAVYSSTSSGPSDLLAQTTFTNAVAGWNHAPLDKSLSLTAGESVYIGWTVASGEVTVDLQRTNCGTRGLRTDYLGDASDGSPPQAFTLTGSDDTECTPAAYLGH